MSKTLSAEEIQKSMLHKIYLFPPKGPANYKGQSGSSVKQFRIMCHHDGHRGTVHHTFCCILTISQ